MIGFSSLLLWASLSIGGASAGCFSQLSLTLKPDVDNEGWNGLGRGFLNGFTPDKLSDEHWEMIGKIYREKDYMLIKDFAMTMGGLVFLVVVSVLLILCFCAAPIALCVFSCTCKKKCKLGPKSQSNIILYSGIGCNSLAMLTIALSILFCYLSLSSITDGIKNVEVALKPIPDVVEGSAAKLKDELKECGIGTVMSSLTKAVEDFPSKISDQVAAIPEIKAVLEINFAEKIKTIESFTTDFDALETKIEEAKTKLNSPLAAIPTAFHPRFMTTIKPILTSLDQAKESIGVMKGQLSAEGGGSIKDKLKDVQEKQKMASKSEIEAKIKEKTQGPSKAIKDIGLGTNKKIDDGFKHIEKVKKIVATYTDMIISYVNKAKEHLGLLQAVNLVLIPCYLALASAIWSTCQASKLAKKKKAKRREKTVLLIPLVIGLCLAFIPLLVSTSFMAAAGVANVACGTVFNEDKSFDFVPKALATFDMKTVHTISGFEIDIPKFLGECRGKSLIEAFNLESKLDKDIIKKKFDLAGKKREMTNTLNEMAFGLPADAEWVGIETTITDINGKRDEAQSKIDFVANKEIPDLSTLTMNMIPDKLIDIPEVKDLKTTVEAFIAKINPFVDKCKADIATAKNLKESELKAKMVNVMVGNAATTPPTSGLMDDMFTKINEDYLTFRTNLLTDFPKCDFVFPFFESIGTVVCDQALGGLNGVYAAIGLAVMSFFSAAVGTVLIWHSFRAGRGPQVDEKTGGSGGSKKIKKKGKKGEKGGEGEEEEEDSPPGPVDMTGKVGEQATPIGSNPSSQPIVVTITHPNGVVQQADPAATGDKTNPSLLPPDVLPADPAAAGNPPAQPTSDPAGGTPSSPNPIQMVHMETNNKEGNEPKSQTGPGGETAGGTSTA